MRVIPYVEDTRNCLLFEPFEHLDDVQMISLQAALKSAIQVRYQLEDNELAAEILPDVKNRRLILFYEATEGGAGVLRQLIDMPKAIQEVARVALTLCHFEPDTLADLRRADRALEDCEAACYHCLMTYANQRDHRLLDRHAIKDYLWHLTSCRTIVQSLEIPRPDVVQGSILAQAESEIEREWLSQVEQRAALLPTAMHVEVGRCQAQPDFLYKNEDLPVAIYVDGDDPIRQQRDTRLVDLLENEGYMVVRFAARTQWEQLFVTYEDLFRRGV